VIAVLIQFAASLVAVGLMVAIAAWLGRPRATPPLDPARVLQILADEFPDERPAGVWIAADGAGAVARSGERALVLFRLGDRYVTRVLPWPAALAAPIRDGRLTLSFGEIAAPRARLAMAAWPPAESAR
jgi:hypothetical protein